MQARIKQLEEELKRKADPQLTVKLVELSQMKERLRQLEEASRADQRLIFEAYNRHGPANDPDSRRNLSFEIGAIQMPHRPARAAAEEAARGHRQA